MRKKILLNWTGGESANLSLHPPPLFTGLAVLICHLQLIFTCNYDPSKIISKTRGVTAWSLVETRDGKRLQVCFWNIQSFLTFERIFLQEFEIFSLFQNYILTLTFI